MPVMEEESLLFAHRRSVSPSGHLWCGGVTPPYGSTKLQMGVFSLTKMEKASPGHVFLWALNWSPLPILWYLPDVGLTLFSVREEWAYTRHFYL